MAITAVLGNPIRVTGTTDALNKIIDPVAAGVFVGLIYWFNPTTAGQLCTLTTKNGAYIAELRAEADGGSVQLPIGCYFENIYCSDMDSGVLYIYTR